MLTVPAAEKDAIRFALASKEIALIHGPPGVSAWSSERRAYNAADCAC